MAELATTTFRVVNSARISHYQQLIVSCRYPLGPLLVEWGVSAIHFPLSTEFSLDRYCTSYIAVLQYSPHPVKTNSLKNSHYLYLSMPSQWKYPYNHLILFRPWGELWSWWCQHQGRGHDWLRRGLATMSGPEKDNVSGKTWSVLWLRRFELEKVGCEPEKMAWNTKKQGVNPSQNWV